MRSGAVTVLFVLLLVGGLGTLPDDSFSPVPDARAQVPDLNETAPPSGSDTVIIYASARENFVELPERGSHEVIVDVVDASLPGGQVFAGPVSVTCIPSNQTEVERNWAVQANAPTQVTRGQSSTITISVSAGSLAAPEFVRTDFVCSAGAPVNKVVGTFTITARVLPYVYTVLQTDTLPPRAGPNELVEFGLYLKNTGNTPATFVGEVTIPEGWRVAYPENVILKPGEDKVLNFQVITGRDKMVYLNEAYSVRVEYYPVEEPTKVRVMTVPMQVSGIYLHQGYLAIAVLAIAIIGTTLFLAVLARRAIEEQILGKPVPPWRIPVEREHLKTLMDTDPDQFYVVRHYLMVEEHRSALLWFAAYKKATKKDRKREHGWFKIKNKQERKIRSVEKTHAKVERKWEKLLLRTEKKRDRKVRRLEKKLRRKDRKKQRKVDRKHKKRVKKIDRKHRKRVRKLEKKHDKRVARETKKVERKNRKLEKKGEEPLPLPDQPFKAPDPPEHPERVVFEEVPLEESRYAKRLERIHGRFEKKGERLRIRQEKAVSRSRLQSEIKVERLQAKIPPEPKTHLYDAAEYLPEDEVVVEDDRSFLVKMLHIPTLEERERLQRRRAVFRSRLKEAKASGDPERLKAVQAAFEQELAGMKEQRREELRAAKASSVEEKRLRKERHRQAKERAREKRRAAETKQDVQPATGEIVAADPVPDKTRFRLSVRTPDSDEEANSIEGDHRPKGLKARFRRSQRAASEEDKKESSQSTTEASTGPKE